MNPIVLRTVERFAEPDFARLQRFVFADMQQSSEELSALLAEEADLRAKGDTTHSPTHRIAAYDADQLVGWSSGWHERGHVFYMANSGVLPSHRRRGIYTALLGAVREHAHATGAVAIRSQHSVLNAPVIMAKLQAGFVITGLTHSAHMGTLVEMTTHFSERRLALLKGRALPYVTHDP